jgi:hypothetical protein
MAVSPFAARVASRSEHVPLTATSSVSVVTGIVAAPDGAAPTRHAAKVAMTARRTRIGRL